MNRHHWIHISAALAVLALPAVAQAGTLTAFATPEGVQVVAYSADPGETNDFFIGADGGTLSLFDAPEIVVDPSAAAFGCVPSGDNADCPVPDVVVADVGDGDDRLSGNGTAIPMVAAGGAGDDRVFGGEAADSLSGEAGNDSMVGNGGNDEIDGGEGDDLLNALDFLLTTSSEQGAGSDVITGGPGNDYVDYDIRAPGVSITLDGVANDGEPGEQDDVGSDIEILEGSTGNDTIIGDGNAQHIRGDLGADRLLGGGGPDRILGLSGNDEIDGGPGADTLFGDFACTTTSCGGGVDRILARDGERDEIGCGPDSDSVVADGIDAITTTGEAQACETLDVSGMEPAAGQPGGSPAPAPPAGTAPGSGTAALGVTSPRSLTPALLTRGFAIGVTSPVAGRVRVTLTVPARLARRLRLRSRTIASGRGTVTAAREQRIRLRLPASLRRRARALRRSTLTLTVVVTGADGVQRRSARSVRVR